MSKNGEHTKYGSAAAGQALARTGGEYRRARVRSQDMLTIDQAAELIGLSAKMLESLVAQGFCICVADQRGVSRLPRWQFQPAIWTALAAVASAIGPADGWEVLDFLETPCGALEGKTPRAALEQSENALAVVVASAAARAH